MNAKQAAEMEPENATPEQLAEVKAQRRRIDHEGRRRNIASGSRAARNRALRAKRQRVRLRAAMKRARKVRK